MPSLTVCRSYPYPIDTDLINVAGDMQALATAIDTDVCAIELRMDSVEAGRVRKTGDSMAYLRLTNTNDASLSSTAHAFQVGDIDSFNIIMDNNEIMARNNGFASPLVINADGGTVTFGGSIDVNGSVIGEIGAFGEAPAGSNPTPLRLYGPANSCYVTFFAEGNTTVASAYLGFAHGSANFHVENLRGAGSIVNTTENAHVWQTGATPDEKMRLTTAGELIFGKTSVAPDTVGVVHSGNGQSLSCVSTSTENIRLNRIGTAANALQRFMRFARTDAVEVGNVAIVNATTIVYNTSSDYRLKDEIGPVPDAWDRVQSLRPIRFSWKPDGTIQDGFFAHEVAPLAPFVVTGEKDAVYGPPENEDDPPEGTIIPQGIDVGRLVPLLTAALQEAMARIEALEAA